jgi:hypothetical protein
MDREKLEARLIQADKRVALGAQHIARQREFVLALERLGNNASAAWALVEQFEKIQNIQIERRDALLKELDKLQARRAIGYPDQSDR